MSNLSTVLLVEESRFFLTIERQFLRNSPVAIQEARTAEQALSLCRSDPPELIYLDYELPDLDGGECCRRLKGDPRLRKIPVVMICDDRQESQAENARRAGCDALLTKPLDRHRFLEIGRSFLAGIRERRRSCNLQVRAQIANRDIDGRALDISNGGLFFETATPLSTGMFLKLSLHLAQPGQTGPWIECTGIVAWINAKDNPTKPSHPFGYGIKLIDVPQEHRGVLSGFVYTLR